MPPDLLRKLRDPLVFARFFWPDIRFYAKQREVNEAMVYSDEVYVAAGNMLGKDFDAGFICTSFFVYPQMYFPREYVRDVESRRSENNPYPHTVRIVTTSVKDDHLRVLWGEIGRFIQSCKYPLEVKRGGPLIVNHRDIRKVVGGQECKISYLRGMVSEKGEGMAGHHAAYTLFVADEACHDDLTEVLTDAGWKLFADLIGTEKMLTMDPFTRIAEYQMPTAIHKSRRQGKMYLYERRCGNFCVTPEHRMLWSKYRANCKTMWSDYYLEPLGKINATTRIVPRCFKWVGAEPEVFELPEWHSGRKLYPAKRMQIADWLEFLGWYVSEGSVCFTKAGNPASTVITQMNEETLNHIANLARRLGFDPHIYAKKDVRIHERRLAAYLLSHGRYSYQKRVPAFVGLLSPRLIEIFLQAFKEGDGYNKESGREILYTSSKGLADDLQILSFKAGREATICMRKLVGLPAPNGISRRDGYVIGRSACGLDSHLRIKTQHLKTVDYDGYVYCATIPPHHTLFTRRRGVCMWSGNSGVDDLTYTQAATWARKMLIFGNCNPCYGSFFYRGVKAGDLIAG